MYLTKIKRKPKLLLWDLNLNNLGSFTFDMLPKVNQRGEIGTTYLTSTKIRPLSRLKNDSHFKIVYTVLVVGDIMSKLKEASERFGDLLFLDSLVVTDQ